MPIIWRPQLSVGNHTIDHDHQYLICLINNVELFLSHPENKNDLEFVLDRLYEYAVEHFKREQEFQVKIGYPNCFEHEIEHQKLLRSLIDIRSEIRALCAFERPNTVQLKEETDRLMELLRHWLIDHVIKIDIGMKEYFERNSKKLFWEQIR